MATMCMSIASACSVSETPPDKQIKGLGRALFRSFTLQHARHRLEQGSIDQFLDCMDKSGRIEDSAMTLARIVRCEMPPLILRVTMFCQSLERYTCVEIPLSRSLPIPDQRLRFILRHTAPELKLVG